VARGHHCRQLHVHRDTVRRVLAVNGQAVPRSHLRHSRIDAYWLPRSLGPVRIDAAVSQV